MPDSVVAANPTVVMPFSLAIAFQQSRQYSVDSNKYADGSLQANALSTTSRKRFRQTKMLTDADAVTLRNFFNAQDGGCVEFWFYDLYETVPVFTWDPTGAAPVGKYTVRFDGGLSQQLGIARNQSVLALIEVD